MDRWCVAQLVCLLTRLLRCDKGRRGRTRGRILDPDPKTQTSGCQPFLSTNWDAENGQHRRMRGRRSVCWSGKRHFWCVTLQVKPTGELLPLLSQISALRSLFFPFFPNICIWRNEATAGHSVSSIHAVLQPELLKRARCGEGNRKQDKNRGHSR